MKRAGEHLLDALTDKGMVINEKDSCHTIGTRTVTVVPRPGTPAILMRPPSKRARSVIPSRPIDSRDLGLGDAAPVVFHHERQQLAALAQRDAHRAGVRVANHIGQRLLHDAKQRQGSRAILQLALPLRAQAAPDAGSRLELRGFPLNCLGQSKVIEHRRPQVGGDLPHRLDADLDQADQRLQLVDELNPRLRIALSELGHQPHELQLQAGQHLPELVVQLAREPRPLFLARRFQTQRQGVEPVLCCARPRPATQSPRRGARLYLWHAGSMVRIGMAAVR